VKQKKSRKSVASLHLPAIPSEIALQVLNEILQGRDPSCSATRDALLASDDARKNIEKMLQGARIATEKILFGAFRKDKQIDEAIIMFILVVCEMHGRYILHKAAFLGCPLQLDALACQVLSWISESVLPFLIRKEKKNLMEDLEMSNISMNGSGHDISQISLSPICFRRFSNPMSDDMNFLSEMKQDVPSYAREVAIGIMNVTILFFAEWLAIGGCGGNKIANQICLWYEVLHDQELRTPLFSSFCRMAIILTKSDQSMKLISAILLLKNIENEEESLLKKMIISAIALSPTSYPAEQNENLVLLIYEGVKKNYACNGSKDSKDDQERFYLNCCATCPHAMVIALDSIICSGTGSLELAEHILTKITFRKAHDESRGNFELSCLLYLCQKSPKKSSIRIKKMIRDSPPLSIERQDSNNPQMILLESILCETV